MKSAYSFITVLYILWCSRDKALTFRAGGLGFQFIRPQ